MATKYVKQQDIPCRSSASATFCWALFDTATGIRWGVLGFFRTESAAKQFALFTGQPQFIVGKVFSVQDIRASRGVR